MVVVQSIQMVHRIGWWSPRAVILGKAFVHSHVNDVPCMKPEWQARAVTMCAH